MKLILVTTSNPNTSKIIRNSLDSDLFEIKSVSTDQSCLNEFKRQRYDLLFFDLVLLGEVNGRKEYRSILKPFWDISPDIEIIVMTDQSDIRKAVDVVKAGASDYLTYPLNPDDIRYVIESIDENKKLQSELEYHRDRLWQQSTHAVLKTNSPLMKVVYSKIRSVAQAESTILITGETGTGKGVIANLIHQHSNRNDKQFISVHCGAITETLIESELFGHEKGAFTGAIRRKLGKFEIAHGGTIFLDEIGTVPLSIQIKLLKVLQEKFFQRVGGEVDIKADVRIITATNSNLLEMSEAKLFRKDLYYRLNVFEIEVPPLREKLEDIPILTEYILKKLNKMYSKNIHNIHPEVLEAFNSYRWPGNIRELENLIERAYILENSSILTPNSFPIRFFKNKLDSFIQPIDISKSLEEVRRIGIEKIERNYLNDLLKKNFGKIRNTSIAAGISERQLYNYMVKYGLHKEDFKTSTSILKIRNNSSE